MNPQILAAAAVCRVVLGDMSANVADALAAVEAWAIDGFVDGREAKAVYMTLDLNDLGEEAVSWLVAAASSEKLTEAYIGDCLATLALMPGQVKTKVDALYADVLATLTEERSEVRDTIPAPEPVEEAA